MSGGIPDFHEQHSRAGIVINASQVDGYRADRPHAATVVCERPECRAKASAWVWAMTKENPVYISDRKRQAS